VANKTRPRVLGARQELLDDIFERAQTRLAEGARDGDRYRGILKNLVLEGFYAMSEPELLVRARKADYDIVRRAIAEAEKEYREKVGVETRAAIDESNPISEGSAGGVSIVGGGGKIEIDNTFEARLSLLEYNALPAVRDALFGKNPNRKFFD